MDVKIIIIITLVLAIIGLIWYLISNQKENFALRPLKVPIYNTNTQVVSPESTNSTIKEKLTDTSMPPKEFDVIKNSILPRNASQKKVFNKYDAKSNNVFATRF